MVQKDKKFWALFQAPDPSLFTLIDDREEGGDPFPDSGASESTNLKIWDEELLAMKIEPHGQPTYKTFQDGSSAPIRTMLNTDPE